MFNGCSTGRRALVLPRRIEAGRRRCLHNPTCNRRADAHQADNAMFCVLDSRARLLAQHDESSSPSPLIIPACSQTWNDSHSDVKHSPSSHVTRPHSTLVYDFPICTARHDPRNYTQREPAPSPLAVRAARARARARALIMPRPGRDVPTTAEWAESLYTPAVLMSYALYCEWNVHRRSCWSRPPRPGNTMNMHRV